MQMQYLVILVFFLGLTGCVKREVHEGVVLKQGELEKLKPEQSNKAEVEATLGSPSFKIGDDYWYYIYSKKEWVAFFKPEIKERHIFELEFNDGILTGIYELRGSENPEEKPVFNLSKIKKE